MIQSCCITHSTPLTLHFSGETLDSAGLNTICSLYSQVFLFFCLYIVRQTEWSHWSSARAEKGLKSRDTWRMAPRRRSESIGQVDGEFYPGNHLETMPRVLKAFWS